MSCHLYMTLAAKSPRPFTRVGVIGDERAVAARRRIRVS